MGAEINQGIHFNEEEFDASKMSKREREREYREKIWSKQSALIREALAGVYRCSSYTYFLGISNDLHFKFISPAYMASARNPKTVGDA